MTARIMRIRGTAGTREMLELLLTAIDKVQNHPKDRAPILELQALLDQHPNLWRATGDLALIAIERLIETYTEKAPSMAESIRQGIGECMRTFGYRDSSPLEQLLIEQILLCWLRLNFAEIHFTALHNEAVGWRHIERSDRLVSSAQRRYLRAIDTLARIRKLNINIQVNFVNGNNRG